MIIVNIFIGLGCTIVFIIHVSWNKLNGALDKLLMNSPWFKTLENTFQMSV